MLKLIVNPASGGKKAAEAIPRIESALAAQGIDVDTSLTTAPGDGMALAAAALGEGYQRFGVVGGDGSINEVVNGLIQATEAGQPIGPLAIFPAGTGNDLAATLELTADADLFAERVAKEQQKQVDICTVTVQTPAQEIERYFVNNLGLGLEAAVTQRYQRTHWVQGILRYVVAALQTIFSYQATEMSATWSPLEPPSPDSNQSGLGWPDYLQNETGKQAGQTMLVTVGNNRRAGGAFYLTPDAQLDDALLDAGILSAVSKGHLVKLLGQALQGKHTHDPAITMVRTPTLSVACQEQLPVQADGELLATDVLQVDISIHDQKLQVYA